MIGFGEYHYRYASGHEGDAMLTGFALRKQAITLYIMPGFDDYQALLTQLGPHTIGKSCLYIKKLADINLTILTELLSLSVTAMKQRYSQ